MKELLDKSEIVFGVDESTQPQRKIYLNFDSKKPLSTIISTGKKGKADLESLGLSFSYNHPTSLYEELTFATTPRRSLILDFFAGSGTTAHAVINLNREVGGRRKYILVEANDYFHTVILPRVKKVVFSDKWKDGKAKEDGKGASHFCKYFALEQYEDTLRRASYLNDSETEQPAFFDNPYESPFASYVFLRDKKMADALAVDYEKNKISVDFSKLYPDIDLAETLSCVKGKFIKSLTAERVTFADGETVKFDELDYRDILPLIWWDK
jgi:adenine-specific DNA-methyltransferase